MARVTPLPRVDWDGVKAQAGDLRRIVETALGAPDRSGRHRCPFHDDRSPSFIAYEDHYHCFGCGAHGDVIDWFVQHEGLTRIEAARRIDPTLGTVERKPRVKAPGVAPRASQPSGRRETPVPTTRRLTAAHSGPTVEHGKIQSQ